MILPALSFLKALDFKSWVIIGLSAALVGSIGLGKYKDFQVSAAKAEVREQKVLIAEKQALINNFATSINNQNAAIIGLSDQSKNLEIQLQAAIAQNKQLNKAARDLITYINNSYVPADCNGATSHLQKFVNEFAKQWNE